MEESKSYTERMCIPLNASFLKSIGVEPDEFIPVKVSFTHTPESSTLHVIGDPSTREYHSEEFDINDIITTEDVMNASFDVVIPKGTDIFSLKIENFDPNYSKVMYDYIIGYLDTNIDMGVDSYDIGFNDHSFY